MKRQTKLTSAEQVQPQAAHQAEPTVQQFNSVEELLRHDSLHTPVPPTIAHRLDGSLGPLAKPAQPWWKRWFGRSKS